MTEAFSIPVGRVAVVADPFGNTLVLPGLSKGHYVTDDRDNVTGVACGALIFGRSGRLLILKPAYKPGWTIPGGVMEADGETPWQACRREVGEECGIELRRLACVDLRRPRPGSPGGIRFLFDCGSLQDSCLAAITVQAEEIREHRLAALAEALPMLRRPIRRRVPGGNLQPGSGLPGRRAQGRGRQQAARK